MNIHYEKYKEQIKANAKRWLQEHPEVRMYHTAKQRAERFNIEFTITSEDIVIPKYCPLLGIKLTNTFGQGRQQTNASLDRIDSTKGYIKGNIQVISDLANRMKQDATKEQLLSFAKNILNLYQRG